MISRNAIQNLLNKGFNTSIVNAIQSVVRKDGISEERAYHAICKIIINIVENLKQEIEPYKHLDKRDVNVQRQHNILRQLILHRIVLGELPNFAISSATLFQGVLRKFREDPLLRACDIFGEMKLDRTLTQFNTVVMELEHLHAIVRDKSNLRRGTDYSFMLRRLAGQIQNMQHYLPWLTACK